MLSNVYPDGKLPATFIYYRKLTFSRFQNIIYKREAGLDNKM